MGLRALEMQVAIPRSQDASKMQEQLSRQGQQFQETLTEQRLREEVIKRHQTNRHEGVLKRDVLDDEARRRHRKGEALRKKKKKTEMATRPISPQMKHPYLGRQIDWSG